MTHTLHPEIEEAIINLLEDMSRDYVINPTLFGETIEKYLGPYLHMPQPIENESVCKNCDNTGIVEVYTISQGTKKLNCRCGRGVEQKQSTPQIEKIDMDKLNMMLYAGSDSEGNSWSSNIPGAIKMIADYINNTLPTNPKSNDQ